MTSVSDIGVVLDSFGQPVKQALRSAAELAFRQIELPVVGNEVSPEALGRTGRRELLHHVRGLGMGLAALNADPGGRRFGDPHSAERHLAQARRVIEMGAELGVPLVTVHLGCLDDRNLPGEWWLQITKELAAIADRTGRRVALEGAGGPPDELAKLLRQVGCDSLDACYDPAERLMAGQDALAGMDALIGRIGMARARDAVPGGVDHPGREVRLGEGHVDWRTYLAALDQAGYREGPFIRRQGPERSPREVAHARRQLEAILRGTDG